MWPSRKNDEASSSGSVFYERNSKFGDFRLCPSVLLQGADYTGIRIGRVPQHRTSPVVGWGEFLERLTTDRSIMNLVYLLVNEALPFSVRAAGQFRVVSVWH
jgi:hypothetical protein